MAQFRSAIDALALDQNGPDRGCAVLVANEHVLYLISQSALTEQVQHSTYEGRWGVQERGRGRHGTLAPPKPELVSRAQVGLVIMLRAVNPFEKDFLSA
jgi:hypothetical protein